MTKRGEQSKRWRESNREKYDAYQKEYREKYYQENKDS